MKSAEFVHLHTHSQYSLLDGACKLDAVIKLAKEYRMPALAITDHGNMFGAIEFYQKAIAAGIKPIIGMEAYISAGPMTDRKPSERYPSGGFHLLLLARNKTGYQNLIKLASAGYLQGFYHKPRIDHEFLTAHSEGLIGTSACPQGEVNWRLSRGEYDEAKTAAERYSKIFGEGHFYLEMQNHGLDIEGRLMPEIIRLAGDTGLPLVCSNDCHYLRREDADAHDALLCIQTGKLVEDERRMKFGTDQIYFKSPDEMVELFGDFPEARENTLRIAEECSLDLEFDKVYLPHFPIPTPFVDADQYLRKLSEEGLAERYAEITDKLSERLNYELDVIKRLGYAGYFLIVKDFIDYARSIKVRVGPGRGSAAGSLVSYSLKITSLDPMKYSLLFERFLNPERISMPDIDIDFADRGRERIIDYVIEKYGKENVTQIITFGTMAARGALRDVGRVLSMPYAEVDRIAKMIPLGADMTLDLALERNAELKKLADTDQRVAKLIDYAKRLEGLTRHASTHAAGVVIAPSALTDFVPLFKSSHDEITTQFDMKSVEKIGLLKMDFLGLRTLTVIDDAVHMIEARTNEPLDIDNIPLDDSKVINLFFKARTIGVFQFESAGMRDYLRQLKPETFDDLIAMNALFRPGPLDSGMINVYVERKHKSKDITYDHPALESILKSTYGVIVFQEQVLQIANSLAGYSMGKADLLRKAMGKKDSKLMAEQEKEFLSGCQEKGVDKKVAARIFDQIEKFARYGFNKAHSVCYAYVAYQTAYLKAHHPREFFAALMTSEIDSADRICQLMEECRQLEITVLPPDVNESELGFTVVGDSIRFGLLAVKNVGEGSALAIIEARAEGGKFSSLAEFASRVNPKSLNRRTLESLISAGATDNLTGNRRQKTLAVEKTLEFGARSQERSASHDLFADESGVARRTEPVLADVEEYNTADILSREKETLGFYVTGHPLDRYRTLMSQFRVTDIDKLPQAQDNSEVRVAGIFSAISVKTDKRGNQMAFATLEDFTGATELVCFSDCYEKSRALIAVSRTALVIGRLSTKEGEAPKILANEIVALEEIIERFDCQLVIKVAEETADQTLGAALEALAGKGGQKPLLVEYRYNGALALIRSDKYRIDPDEEILNKLRTTLGDDGFYLKPLRPLGASGPAKTGQAWQRRG